MDTDIGPGVSLSDYINQTYNNPVTSQDIDWRSPEQKMADQQQQNTLDQQYKMNAFMQKYGSGGGGGGTATPQEGPIHKAIAGAGAALLAAI